MSTNSEDLIIQQALSSVLTHREVENNRTQLEETWRRFSSSSARNMEDYYNNQETLRREFWFYKLYGFIGSSPIIDGITNQGHRHTIVGQEVFLLNETSQVRIVIALTLIPTPPRDVNAIEAEIIRQVQTVLRIDTNIVYSDLILEDRYFELMNTMIRQIRHQPQNPS